jgi:hypothetical protein
VSSRQAGWAPAWRPTAREQGTRAEHARVAGTGGALTGDAVVASWLPGAISTHQWYPGVAPCRLRRDRTHRLGAVTRGGVFTGEGVSGDVDELRELWGGKREVRAALIGERNARRGRSRIGADGGGARTKSDAEEGSPVVGAGKAGT